MAQLLIGPAQAQGQGVREAGEENGAQGGAGAGQLVEALARHGEELGGREGDRVGGARTPVEEGHLAEEIAAAEGGDMVLQAAFERKEDAHTAFTDQEDLVTRVAPTKDGRALGNRDLA